MRAAGAFRLGRGEVRKARFHNVPKKKIVEMVTCLHAHSCSMCMQVLAWKPRSPRSFVAERESESVCEHGTTNPMLTRTN